MSEDSSTGDERLEPEPAGPGLLARILAVVGFIVLGIAVGLVVKQHYSTRPTSKLPDRSPLKNGQMQSNGDLTNGRQDDSVPKNGDAKIRPPTGPNVGDTIPPPAKAKDEEPRFPAIPAPPRGSELRKLQRTTITPSGANTPNHEP